MDNHVYYALAVLSENAIEKANELKMNPHSYYYRALTDPRREGQWVLLVVDTDDNYILTSNTIDSLSELNGTITNKLTVVR